MSELVRWVADNPVRWVIPAILLVALVGTPVALWWEQRRPSSYSRGGDLAWWGLLSVEEQEAVDEAALDVAEQAEIDARQDAAGAEAAEFLAGRARDNALFHP